MDLARSEPACLNLRRRCVLVIAVGLVILAQLASASWEWLQSGPLQDGPLAVVDCQDSIDSAISDVLLDVDDSDECAPRLSNRALARALAHQHLRERGHNSSCRDAILSISPKTSPPTA